jgi:hypothetical protein
MTIGALERGPDVVDLVAAFGAAADGALPDLGAGALV